MARRQTEKGPGRPKIKVDRAIDGDFSSHVAVTLAPGSSISVVERPIARAGDVACQPHARGYRWTAVTDAKLAFGLGGATNASALVVDGENRFLFATDLAFAWTDEIVPDEEGRSWIKLASQGGQIHTFGRPSPPIADAFPG